MGSLVVAAVQFRLEGADLGAEDTAAPYSISWDTRTTSNGSHTLTAIARDTLGVRFASDPVTVTVSNDITSPTVAITSPAPGAAVGGTITVSAAASDNRGVVGVQFRLDGADFGPEDTAAPYSISWDTTTTSDGSHALSAVARDAAGNATTSTGVTVTVSNTPSSDMTPPTVTLTSPSEGETVSGIVTVTVDASDNVGVVGVRFFAAEMPIGTEDTTAPYSIAWDTRNMRNGLTPVGVVARDAAGNGAASRATVTVSNPPPPDGVARFEDTSTAITYTGTWLQGDTSRAWSGGTAALSRGPDDGFSIGASVTFLDKTGVRWIGARGPQGGIARLYLGDRNSPREILLAEVDTYAPTEELQAELFTRAVPISPQLFLTIVPTGRKNASATDALVVVDAFDLTSEPAEDATPPTVAITSPADGATVSGTVTVTADVSDNVGVAGVQFFVEHAGPPDTPLGVEDTSSPYSTSWDTTTTVDDCCYTLRAVARDTSGNATISGPIRVRVSNGSSPPVATVTRFEETDPSVTYTAGWSAGDTARPWSGGTAAVSTTSGAQATFTFTGMSASWIGFRGPQAGIARIFLDGVFVHELDMFSPTEEVQAVVFTVMPSAAGTHTFVIEVTGRRNPSSMGSFIVVDAFDVPS